MPARSERSRATVRDLGRGNRSLLLRALYVGGAQSRQDLSRATGLSAAAVSNLVGDLLEAGVAQVVGSVDSDGGRPRDVLRVNPDHGHVIGVDVGETRVRVELFDLAGTEHAKAEYPLDPHHNDAACTADHVLDGIARVRELADAKAPVLGVGVGVPGIVEHAESGDAADVRVHAQSIGWDAVPFGRLLRAGTDLPLRVENGATTMGQAEAWFGAARGASHAVIALLGSGVGASVLTDGRGYRGTRSSAGEWGHTTLVHGGRPCRCGAHGCLEAYVGAEAILDRYRATPGARPLADADEETSLATLCDLAETSQAAERVLVQTAEFLGAGIGNLINLFNPERVLLGGWAGLQLGRRYLPRVRDAASAQALHRLDAQTTIETCRLGPEAVALGAATLPIDAFLSEGGTA